MGGTSFALLPVLFWWFLDGLIFDHAKPEEVHLKVGSVGKLGSEMWFLCRYDIFWWGLFVYFLFLVCFESSVGIGNQMPIQFHFKLSGFWRLCRYSVQDGFLHCPWSNLMILRSTLMWVCENVVVQRHHYLGRCGFRVLVWAWFRTFCFSPQSWFSSISSSGRS